MRASPYALWWDRRGSAAVELALLSPVLIMLFLGTFEVTQLIRVDTKLGLAAQAIQDIVTAQESETAALLAVAFSGGQLEMTPFAGSALTASIASVSFSTSGAAASVDWQVTENGAAGMAVATACTLAASMSLGSDSVIVVSASYAYTPVLSFLLGKNYALTQVVYGRPRDSSSISGPSTSTGPTGSC